MGESKSGNRLWLSLVNRSFVARSVRLIRANFVHITTVVYDDIQEGPKCDLCESSGERESDRENVEMWDYSTN